MDNEIKDRVDEISTWDLQVWIDFAKAKLTRNSFARFPINRNNRADLLAALTVLVWLSDVHGGIPGRKTIINDVTGASKAPCGIVGAVIASVYRLCHHADRYHRAESTGSRSKRANVCDPCPIFDAMVPSMELAEEQRDWECQSFL